MFVMRFFYVCLLMLIGIFNCNSEEVITVKTCKGDATAEIQKAINKAAGYGGNPVTIRLAGGDYNISRQWSSRHLYHISNTSSIEENADQTKHIGLWFRNLKNVTFDGNGARLVTHGEITTFVIDSCENLCLKNFSLTAADPSVPEITVLQKDDKGITFGVTPPTEFVVDDGLFYFKGEGWTFADGGRITNLPLYAQVFYPDRNVTLRCEPPIINYVRVSKIGDNTVRMDYDKVPDVHQGEIYQLRHGIRNEVCGFINMSKNIVVKDVDFNFMGNFGIVGQFTENITYDNIHCMPAEDSGRTDAGFADFVQMSGCKGKIIIKNSWFEGAHDDPINIHGTHLKVISSDGSSRLSVRYMHPQTFGFTPCFEGDEVKIVDRHTLNPLSYATVRDVSQIDDYTYEILLDRPLPSLPAGYGLEDLAIENITWTPEVEIVNNYFARVPTRGILITTQGKSLIEGNTFFRIPMPSILVSDDARGWYESGAVNDLTIRNNTFIECSSPVICISPEVERFNGPVHKNILIEGNKFVGSKADFLKIRAVDDIIVRDNKFE